MTFNTINRNLSIAVAEPALKYLVSNLGRSGLKIEQPLHSEVAWRPTFFLKQGRFGKLAVEVSDTLYPSILKVASHDLVHNCADMPVSVYVACSLDVYQSDLRQVMARKLRDHGLGLITVDDLGNVVEQFSSTPIIHHISETDFNLRIKQLPASMKVKFKEAYSVYRTNSNQGLQDAGQIIEGLVLSMAKQALRKAWIAKVQSQAANVVDDLYTPSEKAGQKALAGQRASLGAVRDFLKSYRNVASHPPRSAKEEANRIRSCREGFISSIRVALSLTESMKAVGLVVKL